jgi:2,3-bisphosphoglycerate-independent phosphoglycerate mutase
VPSKCVVLLLDGLGDRSYESLGGKTPLQAASTPNLDRLASIGANGLFHAASPGIAMSSENAHFAMFGYTEDEFPGRGYLEALGAGIELAPEDVAILAHFVSAGDEDGVLTLQKDRPTAEPEEIAPLVQAVAEHEAGGIRFDYVRTRGLDGILTLKGDVSRYITDSDPVYEGRPLIEPEPWRAHASDSAAAKTAEALRQYLLWCHDCLSRHEVNVKRRAEGKPPINAVATNRAGRFNRVEPFGERWGLRALMVASGLVYVGLGRFLGMDVAQAQETGDPGADLARSIETALPKAEDYDYIHIHTKAADVASHRKDPELKRSVIEALDRGLGDVLEGLLGDPEILLVVTSDHSTPCTKPLIHSGEPVPISMVGPGIRRDNIERFDEVSCAGGALGFLRARDFIRVILNGLDRVKLRGLMDTPDDQPYWPGRSKPLRLDR